MSFFNIFKKNNKPGISTTDNGIQGPTYLEGYTEHIINPKNLQPNEWRRKLKTPSGQTKFAIKFYGQCDDKCPELIVATEFAPAIVIAVDIVTGQEIVLFDGCKHGYNALCCDTYTGEQINNRHAINMYVNKNGNEHFEIIISAYYSIDYDDEFSDDVDENGNIEIIDGSKMPFEELKRNAFTTLEISAVDENGRIFIIVSEELA